MDGCPMSGGDIDPKNQMPVQPNQRPAPGQRYTLPTDRYRSSIPKATTTPGSANQSEQEEAWLYPSPQMFYNAMRRKGWDPREEDMVTVVSIHNAVNERSWSQVLEWERLHESECERPRLARFRGRPNDLSPKARVMSWAGYKPPFDRHDWIVDRCGTEVRYVIDFYQGEVPKDHPHQTPSAFFLDVRPALDSFGSAYDRLRMGLHSTFPSVFSISKAKEDLTSS
jgi:cytochrome c heme-lyase